jgi:hypothetical protein
MILQAVFAGSIELDLGFDFDARHPYTFAKREAAIAMIPRSKSGRKEWVRFG